MRVNQQIVKEWLIAHKDGVISALQEQWIPTSSKKKHVFPMKYTDFVKGKSLLIVTRRPSPDKVEIKIVKPANTQQGKSGEGQEYVTAAITGLNVAAEASGMRLSENEIFLMLLEATTEERDGKIEAAWSGRVALEY